MILRSTTFLFLLLVATGAAFAWESPAPTSWSTARVTAARENVTDLVSTAGENDALGLPVTTPLEMRVRMQTRAANDPDDPGSWIQDFVDTVIDPSSFTLSDGTLVVTGPDTVFAGISNVEELQTGDLIEAEGDWQWDGGQIFVALWVNLLQGPEDPTLVLGTVARVRDESSFFLTDQTLVLTDQETTFVDIGGVSDLRPGDLVQAGGSWLPGVFLADWVELLQPGIEPIVMDGTVALLLSPNALMLNNGVMVVVHEQTLWVNIAGIGELQVGDGVRVEGVIDEWSASVLADSVELLSSSGNTYIAFEGFVTGVEPPDRVLLEHGSTVIVGPGTVLEGFSSLDELRPGDLIWVEAYTTDQEDVFEAVWLTLLNRGSTSVNFVSVVDMVLPPDWFTTTDGHLVLVDPATTFVGFTALEDLEPGDTVEVTGSAWDNPLEVHAEIVRLTDGEDDGNGDDPDGRGLETLVTGVVTNLRPPQSFVVDDWFMVTSTEHTQWLGELGSYDDLSEGLVVMVKIYFGDDLEAVSVENIGSEPGAVDILQGVVAEAWLGERFLIDSGEWILVDELTVVDGDVDDRSEIAVGMFLTAYAVDLGEREHRALQVFVELVVEDVSTFGFPEDQTSEALVALVDGVDPNQVAAHHNAAIDGSLPGTLVHLFHWSDPVTEVELQTLFDDPDVEDVGPNFSFADPESIRRRFPVVDRSPDSTKFWDQSAVTAADITAAHDRTLGSGTLVAVIDTGVDPFHPLLRHRLAHGGWDYVDDDAEPWETADGIDQDGDLDVDESVGHGTFVAGLILLAAPGATILPYRVLNDDGHGTTFAICQAMLAAMDRGADVINLSFAYDQRPRVLDRILDEASRRGIVLVSGAGNDGIEELPFPAADHRVIAVAATTGQGQAADFSNRGPGCTIAAPGVESYSGCAEGRFCTWSGTSMAAPLVSGAAALLRSVNPYLTPAQIEDALTQSAAEPPPDSGLPGLLQVSAALELVPSAP